MNEKQIKNRIERFNKKLTKNIEKFVETVENTSKDFNDLFPDMSNEEIKGKIILFKNILEQCLLIKESDYDSIISDVMNFSKNDSKDDSKNVSEVKTEDQNEHNSEKTELDEPPRKIKIINI